MIRFIQFFLLVFTITCFSSYSKEKPQVLIDDSESKKCQEFLEKISIPISEMIFNYCKKQDLQYSVEVNYQVMHKDIYKVIDFLKKEYQFEEQEGVRSIEEYDYYWRNPITKYWVGYGKKIFDDNGMALVMAAEENNLSTPNYDQIGSYFIQFRWYPQGI